MEDEARAAASQQFMKEEIGAVVEEELESADLSRTCRRDRYCTMCTRAFCSHCCGFHHARIGFHDVVPIALDGAGRPSLPTHYPGSTDPIPAFIADRMAAADYATPLAIDTYCRVPFCERACHHHRQRPRAPRRGALRPVQGRRGLVPVPGTHPRRPGGGRRSDASARAEEEAAGHVRAVRRAGGVPDLAPLLAALRRPPQPRGRPASGA